MTSLGTVQLADVLKAVRDDALDLRSVEHYRDTLIHFRTDLFRAIAGLKKKRALEMIAMEDVPFNQRKLSWEASEEGQQLIGYEGDIAGLGGEIGALQGRIYSLIR